MTLRTKLIAAGVVLLLVFLAGFLPQYTEARRLRGELAEMRDGMRALESGMRMAGLRDLASLVYLEATQKNFGLASRHSSELFNEASRLAAAVSDPKLKQTLEGLQADRDAVTASLAKGDEAAAGRVGEILARLYEATRP